MDNVIEYIVERCLVTSIPGLLHRFAGDETDPLVLQRLTFESQARRNSRKRAREECQDLEEGLQYYQRNEPRLKVRKHPLKSFIP